LRLAIVGNYPPRRCGIATFTQDLRDALVTDDTVHSCFAVAINAEASARPAYPAAVAIEIAEGDVDSYRAAATRINATDVDVVIVQHEFGIFGGDAGSHVVELLRRLRAPVITTMHTILADPDPAQRAVTAALVEHSARIVTMTEKGRAMVTDAYPAAAAKLAIVPHGIPDIALPPPHAARARLGLAPRPTLLTFGLISPNKGLEVMIGALPRVARDHPDVNYIILGATHPQLLRREGERYREQLQALAGRRRVEANVTFLNRYSELGELCDYLAAADVYVTPYLTEAQITSGTLAYSFGLGKPVVSTPYWHAAELLAGGCGELVPFGDADAIGVAVAGLLSDEARRADIAARGSAAGRRMAWPAVAGEYARLAHGIARAPVMAASNVTRIDEHKRRQALALPALSHLQLLTDDTGLCQHARFRLANRDHGYCIDDNARAVLLLAQRHASEPLDDGEARLLYRYAGFVDHCWNPRRGRFRNHMAFDRRWLDDDGSDDSNARTLWALAVASESDLPLDLSRWAAVLLGEAAGMIDGFGAPRAWAFAAIAIDCLSEAAIRRLELNEVAATVRSKLRQRFGHAARPQWPWFEDVLAYDNARLCEAAIRLARRYGDRDLLEIGLHSLEWLCRLQTASEGHFRPVGTDSFALRHAPPRPFDQQPVEAAATIDACAAAFDATGDTTWLARAETAFAWFDGRNDLGVVVADPVTGASRDGLHPDRSNGNCGAESCLCYLLSAHALGQLRRDAGWSREPGLLLPLRDTA
jgi:glycosyltransferase involved in cell wall biosynthesis